jgi:quercetin dioxygenase-like cupin family protein
MVRKLKWMFGISAAVLIAATEVGHLSATPASGFTTQSLLVQADANVPALAKARFAEIDAFTESFPAWFSQPWISLQKTKGPSDLYVQKNTWAPGGSSGWHTHPGHSLVTVTGGTVTVYEGDDPSCTPHVYSAGMTFVDPVLAGHVHLARNETSQYAYAVVVRLIPADAIGRQDAAANPACGF